MVFSPGGAFGGTLEGVPGVLGALLGLPGPPQGPPQGGSTKLAPKSSPAEDGMLDPTSSW